MKPGNNNRCTVVTEAYKQSLFKCNLVRLRQVVEIMQVGFVQFCTCLVTVRLIYVTNFTD